MVFRGIGIDLAALLAEVIVFLEQHGSQLVLGNLMLLGRRELGAAIFSLALDVNFGHT
jgi:hypothetical protein